MITNKISHIVAFGDSFVEGFNKRSIYENKVKANEISFVNQIKNYSNFITSSLNYGLRSNSNQKISYDCYKWIKTNKITNTFVLVVFTTPSRQAYYKRDIDEYILTKSNLLADEHIAFSKHALVLLLHNILSQKNIPHLFADSFQIDKSLVNPDPELFTYLHSIPYFKKPLNLLTKKLAPCYHPTKEGHIEIAQYLSKHIDIIIKNFQTKEK